MEKAEFERIIGEFIWSSHAPRHTDTGVMRRSSFVLLVALAAAASIAAGCGGGSDASGTRARLVSPAAFQSAIDDPKRITINVHTPDEGSISGTDLAIPFDELTARQEELPPRSTALAVYCRSGRMSAEAVETLAALGFQDIVELEGGMLAWADDGRSITGAESR